MKLVFLLMELLNPIVTIHVNQLRFVIIICYESDKILFRNLLILNKECLLIDVLGLDIKRE